MSPSSPLPRARRSWAEIDLDAIRHNVDAVRKLVGPAPLIMGVVKANAYGHGVGPVARALEGRVQLFGVANVNEAREVRTHLPAAEVFILGPALPDEREEIVRSGFIPSVSQVEEARAFAALADGGTVKIHFVMDTGMGRIGTWQEDALETVQAINALPGLKLAGIASHLPVADEDEAFTRQELENFHAVIAQIRAAGIEIPLVHIENSAGLLGYAEKAGDLVRPGIMLYGDSPLPQLQHLLRAALTWKTRITLLRDVPAGRGVSYGRTFITPRPMRLATLAVGYADGFQRHLTGQQAEVLIGGRRCDVLGRVTMDQIVVDVSALPQVAVGDEVVLLGRQDGEEIPVAEMARKAGTITWEIFTGLGPRVVREYLGT